MTESKINGNSIEVPSSLKYLPVVDEFIEGKLRQCEASDSVIADIAISVSELVTNSITHGNKLDESKKVTVTIKCHNGSIIIKIVDRGFGYDPETIANPLAEENLLKDTGRGVFIVKNLMDDLVIEQTSTGTETTITKNI